jgi:hypothetical protein
VQRGHWTRNLGIKKVHFRLVHVALDEFAGHNKRLMRYNLYYPDEKEVEADL